MSLEIESSDNFFPAENVTLGCIIAETPVEAIRILVAWVEDAETHRPDYTQAVDAAATVRDWLKRKATNG